MPTVEALYDQFLHAHALLCPRRGALICVLALGCASKVASEIERYVDAEMAVNNALELLDANSDGELSTTEVRAAPGLWAGMSRLDRDGDGALTRDELLERFTALGEQSDLIGVSVRATKQGKPLVGAQLTLTPEPFLGDDLQSYSGETEPGGHCRLTAQRQRLPGLPRGYYRVQLVHQQLGLDETIGCEVADDASGSRLELEF